MFYVWRPPNLSELNPIISNMELTHLGFEAFIYIKTKTLVFFTIISIQKLCFLNGEINGCLIEFVNAS